MFQIYVSCVTNFNSYWYSCLDIPCCLRFFSKHRYWISCFAQYSASWAIQFPTDPVRKQECSSTLPVPVPICIHATKPFEKRGRIIIGQLPEQFAWAINSRSMLKMPPRLDLLVPLACCTELQLNKHVCRFLFWFPIHPHRSRKEIGFDRLFAGVPSIDRSIDLLHPRSSGVFVIPPGISNVLFQLGWNCTKVQFQSVIVERA